MTEIVNKRENPAHRKYVPFLDSSYNLYTLIHLTEVALFRARHSKIKELGATSMEVNLLLIADGLGESATPAEISRYLARKRPTVSKLLDRMEKNGLVKRTKFDNNRKAKKIVITDKGREVLEQTTKRDILQTIITSISDEEYRQLWSLLEKLKAIALSLGPSPPLHR